MKKNIFYSIINQLLSIIVPTITTPYISRVLGVDGVGIVSFHYSIALSFSMFSLLGIYNYGSRKIAFSRAQKDANTNDFSGIFSMQIISSTIVLIAYSLYILLTNNGETIIPYFQILIILSCFIDFNWVFLGQENFKITTMRNLVIKLATVIFIFILVNDKNDLELYVLINSIGIFLSNLSLLPFVRKYYHNFHFSFQEAMKHLKGNLIMFIPILAISVYKIVDKVILGLLSTSTEIGYYDSTVKILNIPISLILAIGLVLYPKMSYVVTKGASIKERDFYINNIMHLSVFIAFGVAFGIFLISNDFVPIFFGQGFERVSVLLKFNSISVVFIAWTNVLKTTLLLPLLKEKIYILSVISGAFINLLMNLLLIPVFGAFGAVISGVCAEFAVFLVQTIYVRKLIDVKTYFISFSPYFLSAIISYFLTSILINFLQSTLFNLLISIVLGASIYTGIVALVMRFFDKERFQRFYHLFSNKKTEVK